ncbi:hypothetical protein NNC19_21535 [Clostridium sp. SHJSY1]|uniref:hypothetical protein n=1 Tax=Clostridium sp. SHJSY1 TaxID=2942483 RepID=UPI002876511C|nr:hypothetical protein [Clostridium sp. SHJSY1]MDS0528272.1 hypothetical protein [Clostridium sp. SHJSY1]
MRYIIENFKDISDSKSFMNAYKSSCSFKLLKYIMYIIIFTILSIMIWSTFAEKDIVVNAFGEIDMNNNVCNIYIENTSIGSVKENDEVQIEIISLSRSDYGVINSTIDNISDDVVLDKNKEKKYYTASCFLNENGLSDKNGDRVELKNGMEAKASIISYKTTYFNYILGKVI